MAVTWSNPIANNASASTTNSFSYNAGSGIHRILVVHVGTDSTTLSTGCTYNGVAMTKKTSDNTSFISEIYTLINPASGANTLTLTFAGNQTSHVIAVTASSAISVGVSGSSTGAITTTPQVTMTTTGVNSGIFIGLTSNDGTSITDIGTQSRQVSNANASIDTYGSSANEAAAGSHTYGFTQSSTQGCCSAVELILINDYTLAITQGSYTLTAQTTLLTSARSLVITTGSFVLTGFAALFQKLRWNKTTKSSTTWTNSPKH